MNIPFVRKSCERVDLEGKRCGSFVFCPSLPSNKRLTNADPNVVSKPFSIMTKSTAMAHTVWTKLALVMVRQASTACRNKTKQNKTNVRVDKATRKARKGKEGQNRGRATVSGHIPNLLFSCFPIVKQPWITKQDTRIHACMDACMDACIHTL